MLTEQAAGGTGHERGKHTLDVWRCTAMKGSPPGSRVPKKLPSDAPDKRRWTFISPSWLSNTMQLYSRREDTDAEWRARMRMAWPRCQMSSVTFCTATDPFSKPCVSHYTFRQMLRDLLAITTAAACCQATNLEEHISGS